MADTMHSSLYEALRTRVDARYVASDWPAGSFLCETMRLNRPLQGLVVLDATPVFWNTFTQYLALLDAGAELLIGVSEVMPADHDAVDFLRTHGARLVTPADNPACDIVCDCAGAFHTLKPSIGFVELTRSGLEKYQHCLQPVFLADGGRIKHIETVLGTGESFFRALEQLNTPLVPDQKLVVFGTGKVGSGLIIQALRQGLRVTAVTDMDRIHPSLSRFTFDCVDRRDRSGVMAAIASADALVTATGVRNAVEEACDPQAVSRLPILLANMGVEDEFGPSFPDERILCRKRPINFILDEPTHLRYIDATLSLVTMAAVWLTTHADHVGIILPEPAMEDRLISVSMTHGSIANELKDLYG